MIDRFTRRKHGLAWLLVSAALVGCSTPPSRMPAAPASGGVNLSGRISIKVEPAPGSPEPRTQSMTAQFELDGRPTDGVLSLSTPLGTRMVQARWVGDQAELVGPDGKRRSGSLDALTREALGQSIPVGALMSWLQGQPAIDVPSEALPAPDLGFYQLGWRINLNRLSDRFIIAKRDGIDRTEVRVKLDPGTPFPSTR